MVAAISGSQVSCALEPPLRAWYEAAYGRPPTAGEERMIAFYSSGTGARIAALLGPHEAELELKPPEGILDVGCGYGSIPVFLAARWPKARVLATDVSDRFYSVGRAAAADLGLSNLTFASARAECLEEAGAYDLVLSCNMLNFMNSRDLLERALDHIWRAARPGGLIVVHTPQFWSLREPFTGLPGLQLLPIAWQDAIARRTGRRSLMTDNRHPSLGEIRRVLVRRRARFLGVRPRRRIGRLASTHLTAWFRK